MILTPDQQKISQTHYYTTFATHALVIVTVLSKKDDDGGGEPNIVLVYNERDSCHGFPLETLQNKAIQKILLENAHSVDMYDTRLKQRDEDKD